ncbi:uncharacterized protein LOC128217782 [Mya arenaria]|uniref:uncharacterized protein LOC128217782 n=1 Tax=Mya arenaria TaxID=6604 RepID=UPI0022E70EAE|nr:uncharacterized protein LOC128217782 [Mya arenaria]
MFRVVILLMCIGLLTAQFKKRFEFENILVGKGTRRIPWRSEASKLASLHMFKGDVIVVNLCLPEATSVTINDLIYSNDGESDRLEVFLDNANIGIVNTEANNGGFGYFWDIFKSSGQVAVSQELFAGNHTLAIFVQEADCYGSEFDALDISLNVNVNEEQLWCGFELIYAENPTPCAVKIDSPLTTTTPTPRTVLTSDSTSAQTTSGQTTSAQTTTEQTSSAPSSSERPTSKRTTSAQTTSEQTSLQPTTSERTISAQTTSEQTTVPQTTAPQTTSPQKTAGQTTVPQTTVPQTTAPQTTVPLTTVIQTIVPQTTVPQTTVPQTTVIQTTEPQTTVPQTTVPQTTVIQTAVPQTTVPQTTVIQTTVPQTTVPQTTVPQTTVIQSTAPQTTVPQTTVPQTTVIQTTAPQTTVPQTTVPQTTVIQSTAPQTTVPQTTVPQTTVPQTTVPQTTVPQTTAPQTTAPQTTVSQTTVPQTTVPQTTSPQTTAPQTTVPQTTAPQTTVPQTSSPQTTVPQTTAQQTTSTQSTSPQKNAGQTTVPQTTVPQTTSPQKSAGQTTVPQTTVPQTTLPQTSAEQTTSAKTTTATPLTQTISISTSTKSLITQSSTSSAPINSSTTEVPTEQTTTPKQVSCQQLSYETLCIDKTNVNIMFNPSVFRNTKIIAREVLEEIPKRQGTRVGGLVRGDKNENNDRGNRRSKRSTTGLLCDNSIWIIGVPDEENKELGPLSRHSYIDYLVDGKNNHSTFPGTIDPRVTKQILIKYKIPRTFNIKRGKVDFVLGLTNISDNVSIGLHYYGRAEKMPSDYEFMTFTPTTLQHEWLFPARVVSPSLQNELELVTDQSSTTPFKIDFLQLRYQKRDWPTTDALLSNTSSLFVRGRRYGPQQGKPWPEHHGMEVIFDDSSKSGRFKKIVIYKIPNILLLTVIDNGEIYVNHETSRGRQQSMVDRKKDRTSDVSGFTLGRMDHHITLINIDTSKNEVHVTLEKGKYVKFLLIYTQNETTLTVLDTNMDSGPLSFFSTYISRTSAAVTDMVIDGGTTFPVMDPSVNNALGKSFTFLKNNDDNRFDVNDNLEFVFP